MITIISPSKTINQSTGLTFEKSNTPIYIEEASKLTKLIKQMSISELASLMVISDKLSEATFDKYQYWTSLHNISNSKQAILSFKGEVYTGLDADSFSEDELLFADEHLIILSGLYGVLKSLDLIQPYRLEMATKIKYRKYKNLYSLWSDKITLELNNKFENSNNPILINLASNEYFKSINTKKLVARIITPSFKENKNGNYKIVAMYAKKARGLMARYIIKNKVENIEEIKLFNEEGYYFNNYLSKGNDLVFTRG